MSTCGCDMAGVIAPCAYKTQRPRHATSASRRRAGSGGGSTNLVATAETAEARSTRGRQDRRRRDWQWQAGRGERRTTDRAATREKEMFQKTKEAKMEEQGKRAGMLAFAGCIRCGDKRRKRRLPAGAGLVLCTCKRSPLAAAARERVRSGLLMAQQAPGVILSAPPRHTGRLRILSTRDPAVCLQRL